MNSKATAEIIKRRMSELIHKIAQSDSQFATATLKYQEKYLEDTRYTLNYLANALYFDQPAIFHNYLNWFGCFAKNHQFNLIDFVTISRR
ncbi:MAG: hypothetical protein MZU97_05270 [Bacillus subtilis]|nr:hypothetical protein [Bacillus subtilis]